MEPALKSYICFFALCIPYVPTLPFSLSWMWNVNFRHREAGEKKTGPWFLLSTMPGSPGQSTFHQLQLISFHFDLSSTLFILIAPWIPRYPVKSSLSTHCLFRQGSKTHLGTKPVSPVTGFLQKRQPLRPPQRGWSCGRRWHHCIQNRAKMQR